MRKKNVNELSEALKNVIELPVIPARRDFALIKLKKPVHDANNNVLPPNLYAIDAEMNVHEVQFHVESDGLCASVLPIAAHGNATGSNGYLKLSHVLIAIYKDATLSDYLDMKTLEKILFKGDKMKAAEKRGAVVRPSKIHVTTCKPAFEIVKNYGKYSYSAAAIEVGTKDCPASLLMKIGFDPKALAPEFEIDRNLSAFDMVVYNAICTWYAFDNTTFTSQDLYNIMCGGERHKLHPEMRQYIFDSALRLARTSVDITHYKGDFSRGSYKDTEERYYTRLLSASATESVLGNGTIQDCFRILEEPVLYQIGRATNQILSAPAPVYQIPKQKNTARALVIRQYLFVRMMNARAGALSRVIKYETLFEECEIRTDSRAEKRRIREIVTQILNEWVSQGFLTGFEEQKKGNSIVGVELHFPKKEEPATL